MVLVTAPVFRRVVSGILTLVILITTGFVKAQAWEVKTPSGGSYSPPRSAISLHDYSSAFLSSAYCVDDDKEGRDMPPIIGYVREHCMCPGCVWVHRRGFTTEEEWETAVSAEMAYLEGVTTTTTPLREEERRHEVAGSWIAEAPLSMTLNDTIVDELSAYLGGEIFLPKSIVVSEAGDRVYLVVSGKPSIILKGLLSVGFQSLTPIPPELKIDPALELEDYYLRRGEGATTSTSTNGSRSVELGSSLELGDVMDRRQHSLHVQLGVGSPSVSTSPHHLQPLNITSTTTTAGGDPVQRLSTAWSGMISTRLGHDKAEVMAEDHQHVTVRGLTRHEAYSVALDIARHGDVKWVTPRGRITSSNYFASQLVQSGTWYQPEALGADVPDKYNPLSSELGLTGKGQVVGVADTGLDWNSCFFNDEKVTPKFKWDEAKRISKRKEHKFEVWSSKKHRKIRQYVAYMNAEEDEEDGHGTHVCGSIAGGQTDDILNREFHGVAPDAKIAFFDIYSGSEENGHRVPSNWARDLFAYAYSVDARVYVASFNFESPTTRTIGYSAMARSLDGFCYRNQDFVVLTSAGNTFGPPGKIENSRNRPSIIPPAEAKNAVTVGSHFNPDRAFGSPPDDVSNLLAVAGTSARGPTHDGRIKPDICGPGSQVYSAGSPTLPLLDPHTENCRGVYKDGTSSANAIVAGATILIRQYFTEGYYPDGVKNKRDKFKPLGALLKAVLINSGRVLMETPVDGDTLVKGQVPNKIQGWGGVNLASTLVTPSSPPALQLKVYGNWVSQDFGYARPSISLGMKQGYVLEIMEDTHQLPLKVTLVWYDPPTESNSRTALINDLDLTVLCTDENNREVTYHPNGGKRYGGTFADRHNTVEHIKIDNPQPGKTCTVGVRVGHIRYGGRQAYALVISGPFDSSNVEEQEALEEEEKRRRREAAQRRRANARRTGRRGRRRRVGLGRRPLGSTMPSSPPPPPSFLQQEEEEG